ncbi:lasso peptide biosynthesis B2 protein [Streptomyces sp. NPDC059850]|uniref:lasso peptide biosynthesis B2 protein n=1 Tax=Streptomyces sp. NPDC059850 TaxID=3346970 RepID=UPI003649C2FC
MPIDGAEVYTARTPGGGIAVLDIRTDHGRWIHLNDTGALLWIRLTNGVPLGQAVDDLTEVFVEHGVDAETIRSDLTELARQLRATGLLTARISPAPIYSTETVRPAPPVGTRLSALDRAAGLVGMAVALVLLRCAPIRVSVAFARACARIPRRTATVEQADRFFHAVRSAGRIWPGRSACLEESLGCYVAALLRGRRISWVIGARTIPFAAHAWNEVNGSAIGQDPTDRVWPYAPALRICPGALLEGVCPST